MKRTAVVVDPHPRWREAVERTLAVVLVETVAKTNSFEQASRLVEQFEPDLVVAELESADGDSAAGMTWLTQTSRRFPDLKVIALSNSDDPIVIEAALSHGASVYVVKKALPTDLAVAIRQTYQRSLFLVHPTGDRRSLFFDHARSDRPSAEPTAGASGLTKRELEILRMTATGLSNRQMAQQLWVTEQTVKFHLSNVYRKLGVSNRTQASRQAQLQGLLPNEGTNA